jgi:transglutaminase-like putative cysteine protease
MAKKRTRPTFDWIAFTLLLLMNLVAAWALNATEWADFLELIPLISFIAVWAGAAIARSLFPTWFAAILGTVYGLFIVGWQMGSTMDPALGWRERILYLLGRLSVFAEVVVTGETNQDALIFVILMAALFWFLGVFSVWSSLRRKSAWGSLLPIGLTITAFAFYYRGEARMGVFLGIFIFLGLLVTMRVDLALKNAVWSSFRARVPADTNYRISLVALAAAFLLVGLAWGAPAFARSDELAAIWDTLSSPLDPVKERVSDSIGTVRGPRTVIASEYDSVLELDAGTQPVNRLVMTVTPVDFPSGGGRFYWRSIVYETYKENSWFAPDGQSVDFSPEGENLLPTDLPGRETVEVYFAPRGAALKTLYLPPQPVWVNRTAEVRGAIVEGELVDVYSVDLSSYVYEGESYLARTSIASPTATQLREAGEQYPAWVIERYLLLPDSITDRTLQLAETITDGLENQYDRTVAITRWLRSNIEYQRVTEAPPEGVDPVDWFLFDYGIGFCNYYASAEVVMLRSLGIPARVAAGFARGDYQPSTATYDVYAEDAHSWPEVYFPGVGWVEFEPTVSQPVLTRPTGASATEEDVGGYQPEPNGGSDPLNQEDRLENLLDLEAQSEAELASLRRTRILRSIGYVLSVTALLALAWIRINPTTWLRARAWFTKRFEALGLEAPEILREPGTGWDSDVGGIYQNWTAWLQRLDLIGGNTQTANERAGVFASALPESANDAWLIVDAYQRERFGSRVVEEEPVREAWRRLRGQLWMAWLWKLTDRWRKAD